MVDRISVGVFGAAGRMGAEVCRAVEAAPDLQLVARLDVGDDRTPAVFLEPVQGEAVVVEAGAFAGGGEFDVVLFAGLFVVERAGAPLRA